MELQVIMQELPDYEARKDLESFNSDLTKELEMYQKLIVEFAQDYEQNKNGMSEDTRKKETDLMERQQNYEKRRTKRRWLQQKEQELLQQIMIKVNTAMKK